MADPDHGVEGMAMRTDGSTTLQWWPHYDINPIASIVDLHGYFNEETDYTLTWLVLSTSGIHGMYTTLDELEACMDNRCEERDDPEHEHLDSITVLVIQPRLVVLHYGHIPVTRTDIPWLRATVAKSLAGIQQSQQGNQPGEPEGS